ncbi:MAG TPA: chromosomal replication initiator protein DnaA [Firmicutes bacterium]|jgi:chromosomal replication initiator protein|nr:chromosomal replication initiator protein DnaA [Bacillota bacterium]
MNADDLKKLWDHVLELVGSEAGVGKSSYAMWFKPTEAVRFKDNYLYIKTTSDFACEWIDDQYGDLIKNILFNLTGQDIIPVFIYNDTFEKDSAQERQNTQVEVSQKESEPIDHGLNPRYTFDSFVVGKSNSFAHAACFAVAEAPAHAYNPLFMYGGVGLGKTHLMQAIGHFVIENHPEMKIMYVSAEKFTNDMINSIRHNKMEHFRNKYRTVDLLLVDDIQFLTGKEGTQEEFFHTFNALYEANKQIVICSDRLPKEIATLEDRLRSRFEWGLTTDIQPPDLETRIAILKKKASSEDIEVPGDVLLFIAKQIRSNIRELEGALIRITAYSSLHNRPIDVELAAEALKDILPVQNRQISVELIQKVVAEHYNLNVSDMKSRKRTRSIAFPRQIAMYLSRELTDLSLPKIGEEFGGRDHTTVIHACDKISESLKQDAELEENIRKISDKIQSI